MKSITRLLMGVLFTVLAIAQTKIGEDDPLWRQQTVQRAFSEVAAGQRSSWSEKYLARMADSAAPEIMKCVASKLLSKKDAETAMTLVKMSFANPRLIRNSSSRIPTNTLILLDYLEKHTTDTGTKLKFNLMRQQLQAGPTEHNPKEGPELPQN